MNTHHRLFRSLFFAFAIFQLSALYEAAGVSWTVRITLQGPGGFVDFNSSLGEFGIVEQPGTASFEIEDGDMLHFTFTPFNGFPPARVTDNGLAVRLEEFFFYDLNIFKDHNLVARFGDGESPSPTGSFTFGFKEGRSATPIVDITGSYSGIIPSKKNPFTGDVAMDESGKLVAMGAVDGFTNSNGTNELQAAGSLKTVNDVPTASVNGSTAGTLDGEAVSGSGKAAIPIVVTPATGGPEVQGILASGAAKENGVRFTQKPTRLDVPAQPNNISRAWNLALTIAEKTDAKGKQSVVASSILNLPNGDKTQFKEKKTRYRARGYSILFSRGVKLDSQGNPILNPRGKPVIDKKSRVVISKMLLEQTGGGFAPTSGSLTYKFLGQKGDGDVIDFL